MTTQEAKAVAQLLRTSSHHSDASTAAIVLHEALDRAEAELEQAFREGFASGWMSDDDTRLNDGTKDAAVAAWRERRAAKCDGNHSEPRCNDPECWQDDRTADERRGKA